MEARRQLIGTAAVDESDPHLSISGLVVARDGRVVLSGVELAVAGGEVVAVQGPSGSGKTTLLAAACGLIVPTAGVVSIGGCVVSPGSDRSRAAVRLRDVGLVFQGDELLPELTLGENVALPLRLLHRRLSAEGVARVDELVDHLGIGSLRDRLPAEVSGGQLQRAAVARALVHRPSVVLADEPTAALDGAAARSALSSLIALARENRAAVVVVTHDDEVAAGCDRVLELEDGRLVVPGHAPAAHEPRRTR